MERIIHLYHLIENGNVKYVGLTCDLHKRKISHKRMKPPHDFVEVCSYESIEEATKAEQDGIIEYGTLVPNGWNISPGGDYMKNSGYFRKGIGGAKKGRVPWNKGKQGCFSKDVVKRMCQSRKGKIASKKFSLQLIEQIRERFSTHPVIDGVGKNAKNGVPLTQERAFSKLYASEYGMTVANMVKILLGRSRLIG